MEDNNNSKRGRGRPKKVKDEEPDKTGDSSFSFEDEEDGIRKADGAKVERLVNNSFEPEFDVLFRFKTKGDHPGLKMSFQIHRWYIGFTFYESRHWDYENDRYESEYPAT
jgi:hypothetical protein